MEYNGTSSRFSHTQSSVSLRDDKVPHCGVRQTDCLAGHWRKHLDLDLDIWIDHVREVFSTCWGRVEIVTNAAKILQCTLYPLEYIPMAEGLGYFTQY